MIFDFAASNGIKVSNLGGNWDQSLIQFEGEAHTFSKVRDVLFEDSDLFALGEYFRAREDERLGRWRWPEDSDFVVYPHEDGGVWVHSEREPGAIRYASRDEVPQCWSSTEGTYVAAARAYFAAHPEPKPWHAAEEGEAWLLTIDGHEIPALVQPDDVGTFGGAVKFFTVERGLFGPTGSAITEGRRVWPEVSV